MLLYTDLARRIMEDVISRVRDLRHIDPDRVAILAAARCSGQLTGNLATCYGLNREQSPTFSVWTQPGTRRVIAVSPWFRYTAPRVRVAGREANYLILLRLPRLLLHNPLPILIHELYHIGVNFDTSLRPLRHGAVFDREVRRLTHAWLERQHGELAEMAQLRLPELQRRFGAVLAYGAPSRLTLPLIERVHAPGSYEKGLERLYPGHILARRYEVRQVEWSPADAPRLLLEKDLVLRHYNRRGSERVPRAFARYSRQHTTLAA